MTLEPSQLLATAATLYGVGGALSVLLQARQMRARGASGDVSLRFLTTYVGGYAVWLLYGISIDSLPLVLGLLQVLAVDLRPLLTQVLECLGVDKR